MANNITIVSGSMQGAFISTLFAAPVVVLVRNAGVPQSGVTVTSIVPGSGASATTSATLITNSSGNASFTLTANGTNGQYAVGFSVAGGNTASVLLKNSTPASTSQTAAPTLCTQDASGGGPLPWTNPGNIIATGTSLYAECVMGGANTSATQLLYGAQFGFTIPTGSVFTGAEFTFKGLRAAGTNSAINAIALVLPPFIVSTIRSVTPTTAWRTTLTVGGAGDTWGLSSLTAEQINDPGFKIGLGIAATTSVTWRTNEWGLKIYYSNAPSLPVADTVSPLVFCAN